MRIPAERDDTRDDATTNPEGDASGANDGDFRGPYGFGRPAHRPDPNARYGFEPEAKRALDPRVRKAREARLRGMATRQGLHMSKQRGGDPEAIGGYMLLKGADRSVAVLGGSGGDAPWNNGSRGYEASLDEIEAYLLNGNDL